MSLSSFAQQLWLETRACIGFLARPKRLKAVASQRWHGVWVSVQLTLLFMLMEQLAHFALDPLQTWAGLSDRVDLPDALYAALLWVGCLVPVIEEFMFRAGLRRLTYSLFVLPPMAIAVSSQTAEGMVLASLLGLLAFTVGMVLMRAIDHSPTYSRRIAKQFVGRFAWFFWGNATLFGLVHANHFMLQDLRSLVVVALLLPYIAMGAFLGYLRLRYGLLASITAHAVNNSLNVVLLFTLGSA